MDDTIDTKNSDAPTDGVASTSSTHAEDEPLSESLFHSCIDAEFFDSEEIDSQKHQDEMKIESNKEAAVAGIEQPRTRTSNISQNEASNSSSTSSWSHLPAPQTKVNSITFDRERSCVILSTSHGVRIRTLDSLHYDLLQTQRTSNTSDSKEEWIYDIPFLQSGVTYAQFLRTKSILAVILPENPRCCILYNAAKNTNNPLAALPMSAAVKRVELTKKVLVCITADGRLHVFHMNNGNGERPIWIQSLNVMHPSDTTRNISRGNHIFYSGSYFDLSPTEDECYLVCKSFNGTAGTIRVYDPTNILEVEVSNMNASVNSGAVSNATSARSTGEAHKKVRRRCHLYTTIDSHEHPVTRMVIGSSSQSSYVATASNKGTTIRVFGLPHGQQLYEWHRGSRSCQILSLSWNGMGDRLVSYGSSNTIHVFEWNNQQQHKRNESTSLEHSHPDARDFDDVRENIDTAGSTSMTRVMDATPNKSLYKRIGAAIRLHTGGSNVPSTPLKHRSFVKLKYQSNETKDQQQLVVAVLDRHDTNVISGSMNTNLSREDTVVMCTLNGELRQYSVKLDGTTKLVQLEDVLVGE